MTQKKKQYGKELRVCDVSIGDLLEIRSDTVNFLNVKEHDFNQQTVKLMMWSSRKEANYIDDLLLYTGRKRIGSFVYHQFLRSDEVLYTRGRNFRYLKKV